jgi:hypothetical protein
VTAQSREDAVSIFTELGWPDLPYDRLATADIGTDDQRRRARTGLATGPLQVYAQDDSGVWTWISKVDHADLNRLSIFAIRVGVDARRAASIVPIEAPRAALLQVISERGTAYATQFIARVCTSSRRAMTHQPTVFADVALRLVLDLELPVPDNVDYLIDWAAYADAALDCGTAGFTRSGATLVTADHIVTRFAEHARAAVAVGAPMTGPLRPALHAGVSRGLVDRDEMLDLAVVGLDAARRPGDRAAWAQFLTTELAMSDDEITDRAEQWIPALATGTPEVIERLGLPLFTGGPDELLADLVAATVPGVKARRLRTRIFDALACRSRPADATVTEVSATLAEVATSPADVKSLAALTQAWEMSVGVADAPADIVAWTPTPEVWAVPRFDAGPATPDHLTESIRPLMDSAEHDFACVDLERFLSLAVSCARDDIAATRTAVRGVRDSERSGLAWISEWRQGQLPRKAYQPYGFTQARDYAVVCRLGEISCVLSQPSWDDLRIDAAEPNAQLCAAWCSGVRGRPGVGADSPGSCDGDLGARGGPAGVRHCCRRSSRETQLAVCRRHRRCVRRRADPRARDGDAAGPLASGQCTCTGRVDRSLWALRRSIQLFTELLGVSDVGRRGDGFGRVGLRGRPRSR